MATDTTTVPEDEPVVPTVRLRVLETCQFGAPGDEVEVDARLGPFHQALNAGKVRRLT